MGLIQSSSQAYIYYYAIPSYPILIQIHYCFPKFRRRQKLIYLHHALLWLVQMIQLWNGALWLAGGGHWPAQAHLLQSQQLKSWHLTVAVTEEVSRLYWQGLYRHRKPTYTLPSYNYFQLSSFQYFHKFKCSN